MTIASSPARRLPARVLHSTRRIDLAAAVVVSLALILTACGSSSDSSDAATTTIPTTAAAPPATAIAAVPAGPTAGPTLVSPFLFHDVWLAKGSARPIEADSGAAAALAALMAGPTEADVAAGLTSAFPTRARLISLTVDAGVATVDFDRAFETRDAQPQTAQVVFTLTQVEGVTAVQFLIDGEPNGATGVKPLTRASFARYTPPAVVESPTPGQTVSAPIAVSGTASTPAGTVTYRLEDPFGSLLAEGSFVHGDDGSGRGPFAGSIDSSGFTGPAVLIVPAPDPSLPDASLTRVPITIG